eukprot:jgi/Psemu1/57606/gm1.57606_g
MPTFTDRFFQTLGAVTYPAFYIMRNNDLWRQKEGTEASQSATEDNQTQLTNRSTPQRRRRTRQVELLSTSSSSSSASAFSDSDDTSVQSLERHHDSEMIALRRQAEKAKRH